MPNEQRQKILEAARSTFIRKGAHATIDDIAAAAKVSHGLAYRYFPNKAAIIRALVREAIQSSATDFADFENCAGGPEEGLTALVSGLVENRRQRPELYLLIDQLRKSSSGRGFGSEMRRRKEAFLKTLRRLIVQAQARGKVYPGDPDHLVAAIGMVLEGLTAMAAQEPERFREICPGPEVILRMLIPGEGGIAERART
jgi:AcrR family transcriptional regulator